MKQLIAALLFFSSIAFSQSSSKQNLLSLENSIKSTPQSTLNKTELNLNSSYSKKSTGLAILYSVLLPGMGELYAGDYSSGKYFTIAEGALWGVYFGLNTYGNWQQDRYKAYAASSAGVNLNGKNDTYFANIGTYLNITEYNDDQSRNRDFVAMYNVKTDYWKWQTNKDREVYRNMWTTSEQAHNGLRFVVGALILNRLVSAINAARLVAAYNHRQSSEVSWNVSVSVTNQATIPTGLQFNFTTQF